MKTLKVEKTPLEKVLLITPLTHFKDLRGEYVELYHRQIYREAEIDIDFVEDDISVSKKNVLRGIHGDEKTWKLVSCLYGEFYLVVINWDPASPQYKQWISFNLSQENRLQVLIPPKFGNGHVVLSEKAIFHYKQSAYYDRAGQFTLHWDDPELKLRWPVQEPILSDRDKAPKI